MGLKIFKLIYIFFLISDVYAFNWWQTADQEAYKAYQNMQYQKAMSLFKRQDWHGVAAFRQKNYSQAIKDFSEIKTPEGLYNLGTALAFQGDYENAIKAYRTVLSISPEHSDARHNLAILEKIQSQKEKQQQEHQNNKEEPEKANKQNKDNGDQNQNKDKTQKRKQEKNKKDKSISEQNNQERKQVSKKSSFKSQNIQDSQWLKLIEDDPAGLLKQKFLRDYQREVDEGKA